MVASVTRLTFSVFLVSTVAVAASAASTNARSGVPSLKSNLLLEISTDFRFAYSPEASSFSRPRPARLTVSKAVQPLILISLRAVHLSKPEILVRAVQLLKSMPVIPVRRSKPVRSLTWVPERSSVPVNLFKVSIVKPTCALTAFSSAASGNCASLIRLVGSTTCPFSSMITVGSDILPA